MPRVFGCVETSYRIVMLYTIKDRENNIFLDDIIYTNNKKFRSFNSKQTIHKKEVGPYRGFGYLSLISDPINLAKEPEDNAVNL